MCFNLQRDPFPTAAMSFGRPAQLSWCNVCGQAVVTTASGPIGMGVRIDDDTIVHEHCFKCSSCHRRLSLETYRQDKLDKRFYCAKHHNGYNVVGGTQSLPRVSRHSVAVSQHRHTNTLKHESADRRRVSSPVAPSKVSQTSPRIKTSLFGGSQGATTATPQSSSQSPLSSTRNSLYGTKPALSQTSSTSSSSSTSTVTSTESSSSLNVRRTRSGSDVNAIHIQSDEQHQIPVTRMSSSGRIKAAKAATHVSTGRSTMPNTDVTGSNSVSASLDDERYRSGSIPRGDDVIARSSSDRSSRMTTKADTVTRSSSDRSQKPAVSVVNRRRASANYPPSHLELSKQTSSGTSLEDEDCPEPTVMETRFLIELRQYKANCLRLAKAMEETGDVTPTAASNANESNPPAGSITPRQYKRLPIPEMWSSSSESSRFIQPVYGYFTEAIGSPKATARRKSNDRSPRDRAPSPMLDRRISRSLLVSPVDVTDRFQLEPLKEDLYELHFANHEHWNFYTQFEPEIGPCILTLKQEVISDREQFRILIRSQYGILHGLLPPTCLLANRYNRKEVVAAVKKELGFVSRFHQAMTPTTSSDIIKLDKAFSSRQLKVGLLYVAAGQRTEEEILNNASGSRNFDEFMSEIADRITLKDFSGFRGGLDAKHEQTGEYSLYREWNQHEVMFHVSTLLPHAEKDRQQLQKKRHIGNDMVCIVFVDDMETPFDPTCIRSHFLHTFVVVHCDSAAFPKRYRVDIVARDSVPQFGPALATQNVFPAGTQLFSEFLLTKLVNAYRATCRATKFNRLKIRTLTQMIKEATNNFALHEVDAANRQRKMQRRGSWLPDGATRPPSPLRDSVREEFMDSERLAQDLQGLRTACKDLCDVNFIMGDRREAVCAIKAVLAVRSVPFREFFHNLHVAGQTEDATPSESETAKLPKRGTSSNRIKLHLSKKEKSSKDSKDSTGSQAGTPGSTASPIVRRKSRKGRSKGSTESESSRDDDAVFTPSPQSPAMQTDDMGVIQENEVLVSKAPPLTMVIHQMAKGIGVFQVNDFSLDTFSAALDFVHSASCDIKPGTIIGLACAAALLGVSGLEKACNTAVNNLLNKTTAIEMLKG